MKTRIHTPALMIAAIAMVAAACGGGETASDAAAATTTSEAPPTTTTTTTEAPASSTTTTTMAATTTTSTSTTTTTTTIPLSELVSLETTVESGGAVVGAGTYAATSLGIPVRYELAGDVSVSIDSGHYIGIQPAVDGERWVGVYFAEFAGLPQPDQVPLHDHSPDSWISIDADEDWAGFFDANDGIVLLDSGTAEIGDTTAAWWDFTAADTAGGGYDCNFGSNCFNVAVVQGDYWIVGEELGVRVWKLDSAAGTLHAWFQAPLETFADNLPFGETVTAGVTVGS